MNNNYQWHRPVGVSHALSILSPTSKWYSDYDKVENLVWLSDPEDRPSDKELHDKIKELEKEYPYELLRKERNKKIAETDWWVFPDRTPTQEQLDYRQALRDITKTQTPIFDPYSEVGFTNVTWPEKP
jgi:hypothetical protein